MIRLVDWCLRFPRRVAALAVVVLALAAFGITQLGTSAAVRTLVGTGSEAYKADRLVADRFGDETILVLVRSSAADIGLTDDLQRLADLEQCLAGATPTDGTFPGGDHGPCAELAHLKPARVVYGPGTFATAGISAANALISEETAKFQTKLAEARPKAEAAARKAGKSQAEITAAGTRAEAAVNEEINKNLEAAEQYGLSVGGVSLKSTDLIGKLLFDPGASQKGTPRAKFLPIFPTRDVGLVAMRLRADLTDAERIEAVGMVEGATALPEFKLAHGSGYVVSGAPVLVSAVASELQQALLILLGVGVLVMALVLMLTFPERRRLRPLALALGTVAIVFGAVGLLGLSLDLGTIATLPVLLGLAVDYGVQLHARVEETRREGLDGADAVRAAVARGGRPVLLAAGATLAGFVALFASPTPLVRGFALVLFVGVAVAVFASFTIGLVLHARGPLRRRSGRGSGVEPATAATAPALSASASASPRRWTRFADRVGGAIGSGPAVRRLVAIAHGYPVPVLSVGVLIAVVGVIAGSHERVETDLQRLVPSDLAAVKDAQTVERATGQAGEVQVLIQGKDLATPEAMRWMDDYRARVLDAAGYDAERGCSDADLCPLSPSFRDLVGQDVGTLGDGAAVRAAFGEVPAYFVRAALTEDAGSALMSFGVPLGPADQQIKVLDRMREQLDPPAGITATVTGLPVLFSDASTAISSPTRRMLTLLGSLVLVGLVLRIATRSWRRGLVPVLPVALAAGWSGFLTWVLGLPLNPLSVVLGALIVAIGTEFGVLLVERYHQEREAGYSDADAIARTATSTGRAVGASAATTLAGFAVLAVSDIPLLRQFGLITVLDLAVAVLAVVIVLPAVAGLAARRSARTEGTESHPSGPTPARDGVTG